MIKSLLSKLANAFISTASRHKKKLIFVAILIIGFQIARRKIKTQAIVSIVMFFVKFWSKMMQILPLPAYANYRFIEAFQFMQQSQIPQLATVIDLRQLLMKIKNKEPGALNQLKISVISAVLLNIILYKVDSIYELIKRKYSSDFSELGAGQIFQQSINLLKAQFVKNLSNFRIFIASELNSQLQQIDLLQVVNQNRVLAIFNSLIENLQKDTLNMNQKVLSHKTSAESTKQYKIAENYYKTTKQYIQQRKSTKIGKIINILFYPATALLKGVSSLLKSPEQSLTNHRFTYVEYFYILPLKKFRNNMTWPNLQSKHLFEMVVQQLINFFYSINFSIVSSKKIQYNLRVFMNRIAIYFTKKAKCQSKKFMDLLPIFFKIIQQQIIVLQRRKDFYERQLISAFKDTKYTKMQNMQISECRLRNRVLQEIYYKNQVQHLQRDMQAKLYNERDGLVIDPVAKSSRIYEQKDEIQQLMQIYNRADVQKQTSAEQIQMMRELVQ